MELIISVSAILIIISSALLALLVYNSDHRSKANRLFFGIASSIIFWNIFSYFAYSAGNDIKATIFFRLNFLAVTSTLLFFYFFSINFPLKSKHTNKYITYLISILGAALIIVTPITNWVIKIASTSTNNLKVEIGLFGYIFYFFVFLVSAATLFNLTKKYASLDTISKSKVLYFIVGIFIYTFLNIFFNFIIFFLFPLQTRLTQFGDFSAIFLLGFTAYAIIKHQLFNIKIIATETTVVALSVGLIIEVFMSNDLNESLLKLLVWVLATYGGYVLIKSVKVEIKQKEELANLANALENANTKLQELDEAKDNFLSMASHELNTPIAAIEGYLSMIIDENMAGNVNVKMKRYLNSVFISSKRLAALVRDLLNVSRIESNRIHIIYTEGHVEDTIQQAIDEVKIKADEVGHKLTFKKPDHKLPKTWFDQSRITEVIINFIGNSIKYTEPGGKIVVSAHADDNKIVVAVTDNGRGIPDDRSGHIFEKFAQVDVMKDQVKGTGLGMFISKNLIELHKGKIWFKSSVDPDEHGTTFYFSLPILKEKPFDKFDGQGEVITLK